MQKDPDIRTVSEHYENMSEGDRSCVFAMVQSVGAQQMTSIGSSHDLFYKELSKGGWAESADISPELARLAPIHSWKFTKAGIESMPSLLLALTTTNLRKDYRRNRFREFLIFGAKLITSYAIIQMTAFFTALIFRNFLTQNPTFASYISVGSVLISISASLFLACKIWNYRSIKQLRIKKIAYSEFLFSEIKTLAVVSIFSTFIWHLIVASYIRELGLNTAENYTHLLIQIVVYGGLIWFVTRFLLPIILEKQRNKQFRLKVDPL